MNIKAFSPVIGTVLLISIVLVVGVIIFSWAKSSIIDLGPIQNNCEDVSFTAEVINLKIGIVNKGNINLQGIQIKSIEQGKVSVIGTFNDEIKKGESKILETNLEFEKLNILIVPIISAKTQNGEVNFNCQDSFGIEVN